MPKGIGYPTGKKKKVTGGPKRRRKSTVGAGRIKKK